MFVLYVRKVSLIKYIRYKNVQKEWGEPFHKKGACSPVIFISQHFDWVLLIPNVIKQIVSKVVTS